MTTTFAVRLAGIPREVAAYGFERTEELLREFRLMSVAADAETLPARITELHGALREAADGRESLVSAGVEQQPVGVGETFTVQLQLPIGAERDAVTLALLLDESDDYCRRGAVLTLPRTGVLIRLRWWQATEVVRQRYGLPPTVFAPSPTLPRVGPAA